MNALSLYSGGCDGISLAGSWLGITTLAYCDSDPACRAVLRQRHPDAPIFDNDEDVNRDALLTYGIDPTTIDIVFGGPPCQIASVAGQRLGAADPRNRWPQFLAIVRSLQPRWVMAENVPALLSAKGKSGIPGELFGDIIATLAEVGYRVGWCCYGAADVGAPHKRERLFIVGYAEHARQHAAEIGGGADARDDGCAPGQDGARESARPGERHVGDTLHTERGSCQPANDDTHGDHAGREEAAGRPRTSGADGGERHVADAGSEQLPNCRQRGLEADHPEAGAGLVAGSAGCSGVEHAEGKRYEAHGTVSDRTQPPLDSGGPAEDGNQGPVEPELVGDASGLSPWMDRVATRLAAQTWPAGRGKAQFDWEPPRVATGIPDRAARIRMIGNSCPPQQYAVILAAIVDADRHMKEAIL